MRINGEAVAAAVAWILALAAWALCLLGGHKGCVAATKLGSEGLYFLLGVVFYVALDGRLGGVGVAAAALAASSTVMLKQLLEMPRPPGALLAGATGPGFPSGHTTVATAFWLGMGAWAGSPVLVAGALALSAAVGYTRVALGVHFVGDVVGGFLVGAVSAVIVAMLTRRDGLYTATMMVSPSAFLAAAMAAILSPTYCSTWRLLGISTGLYLASLQGVENRWENCLRGRPGLRRCFVPLALPLGALAGGLMAERLLGPLGSVIGFAVFAWLALAARPLTYCPRRGGSRDGS